MSFIFQSFTKGKIISTDSKATVAEAVQIMADNRVGSILILDGDKLSGIFTERDLLNGVIAKGLDPKTTGITKAMSQKVCTINIDNTVEACYALMQNTKCRHLPILEEGKIVGIVTMRDLLERKMKEVDHENKELKDYLYSS
jgi:CBS domain-containing protein